MTKPKIQLKTEPNKGEQDFSSLRKLNDYLKEIVENNVFFMFVELLKKISLDYQDRGLSFDELKTKYLSYFQNNLTNSNLYCEFLSMNLNNVDFYNLSRTPQSPTQTKEDPNSSKDDIIDQQLDDEKGINPIDKEPINEIKCYARTSTGVQCSRRKQKNSDFCGSHAQGQPYGRIDQQCPVDNHPKKRGRPPLPQNQQTITKNTDTEPEKVVNIEASIETIDGIDYVIDNNNQNIYKVTDDILDQDGDEISLDTDKLKLVGKKSPDGKITWYTDADLMFIKN